MKKLLQEINACSICAKHIEPRPVLQASASAKILVIGQAPGAKVHQTGVPWDDASGKQLRKWMGVDTEAFYNANKIALIPMGFCYPGKGKSGDLPPRPECAPQWHRILLERMNNIQLTILIGQYAQQYYLKELQKENLTATIAAHKEYLPDYLPLPHPSPRNRFWLSKNPWFEENVVPYLQQRVQDILQ